MSELSGTIQKLSEQQAKAKLLKALCRIKVLEKMVNVWKDEARERRGCIEELREDLERRRVQVVTLELQLQRALVDVVQAKKPELTA